MATVADFLLALPFRYEDRRHFATVASLEWEKPATILVHFQGVRSIRMRRGLLRVEAVADDGTGAVRVVWHNRYPSFAKALTDKRAALYGTPVAGTRGEMRIENPETELFDPGEEADPLHSGRIVGIYHRLAEIPSRPWRVLVRRAPRRSRSRLSRDLGSGGDAPPGPRGGAFPDPTKIPPGRRGPSSPRRSS